jgi:Glycosyl hydrolase family 1
MTVRPSLNGGTQRWHSTRSKERPLLMTNGVAACSRPGADREFGPRIRSWASFNEPGVYAFSGYVYGTFPPGKIARTHLAGVVVRNMLAAHTRVYQLIKSLPGELLLPLDPVDLAVADSSTKNQNMIGSSQVGCVQHPPMSNLPGKLAFCPVFLLVLGVCPTFCRWLNAVSVVRSTFSPVLCSLWAFTTWRIRAAGSLVVPSSALLGHTPANGGG